MKGSRKKDLLTWLLTEDFFPEISAKVRRVILSPLGCLCIAALVALACGLLLHPRVLSLFAALSALIGLGVAWPWVTIRGLKGILSFGVSRISEGETVGVRLDLTNRLPWPAWGVGVTGGFGQKPGEPVARIPGAGPRCRTVRHWEFRPSCRGVYPGEAPRLTSGFPFGLWESSVPVSVEGKLIVWPRTFPVGTPPVDEGTEQAEGMAAPNKVGTTGDILGVRPYRRGDPPRRIHWQQSARHDRLIVCELQANARPVIQLVLDINPAIHVGTGPDGSCEWAIRVAASLAKGWLDAGAVIALATADRNVAPNGGRGQVSRILDALARLSVDRETPLTDVLAGAACRSFRVGLQVVVTTDQGAEGLTESRFERDRRRWVVLKTSGFGMGTKMAHLQVRPWLSIESAAAVPGALRSGWKEVGRVG